MENDQLVESLVLALAAATSWKEGEGDLEYRRAWKGYDFGALDSLAEKGLVDFSHKAKSLHLTDEGYQRGCELIDTFSRAFDQNALVETSAKLEASSAAELHLLLRVFLVRKSPDLINRSIAKTVAQWIDDSVPHSVRPEDRPQFDPLKYRKDPDYRAFRIRIELDLEDTGTCWREILVPASCTFLDLHIVAQRVFC